MKPEFWESESVGRLSIGARLLFIACLNFADDEGLIRWNEAYLSSQAFVYDELPSEQISEWMRELVTEKIVLPYKSAMGQRLAWIVSFRVHQVINRPQPGKLPPPSIQNREVQEAIYQRDRHVCHLCGEDCDPSADPTLAKSKAPSLDHIVPKGANGSDYPSNLATAHISCNKGRKDKALPASVNGSVNRSLPEGKGKEGNREVEVEADPDLPDSADTRILCELVGIFDIRQQSDMNRCLGVYARRSGKTTEQCISHMSGRWNEYQSLSSGLDWQYGSAYKFFMSGKWDDPKQWPRKEKKKTPTMAGLKFS